MNALQGNCKHKVYESSLLNPEVYFNNVRNMTVLDVGCGVGKLSEYLTREGNVCYGITISEAEAVQAKRRMKQVFVMDLEEINELPLSKKLFDCIIFADVLEHLRNPQKTLRALRPYLKDTGTIYCSIPNIANAEIRFKLLLGHFDYEPRGVLDNTHTRFFTRKTAIELIRSSGFRVNAIRYTHPTWHWFNELCKILPYNWELTERLVNIWPTFFATQFVIFAKKIFQ